MAFDLAAVESLIGRGIGAVARPVGRAAWWGTKNVAPRAIGAGVGMAYAGAKIGAAGVAGLGGAAAITARAAFNTAWRGAGWAGRTLGRGGAPFKYHEMTAFGRTIRIPESLNRATHNALVFGTLGAAGAAGIYAGIRGPKWDVNQAIGTGVVEVERPDSMGATGSLALSMATGARRRQAMGQVAPQGGMTDMFYRAAPILDDVALMALHGVGR